MKSTTLLAVVALLAVLSVASAFDYFMFVQRYVQNDVLGLGNFKKVPLVLVMGLMFDSNCPMVICLVTD